MFLEAVKKTSIVNQALALAIFDKKIVFNSWGVSQFKILISG
jgi:hypothetical protein